MERGAKLRQLRRLKDLTQQNIADEIGISQRHVARIESGKAQPRIDILELWCAMLDITIRKLEKLCKEEKKRKGPQ
ncbi:MAG: helix-turn-helix domain-containing protein [Flavobacteriales bacterium]|nr:helix-turn-helix domain-containing protein [Flavobacteriales bacterium]